MKTRPAAERETPLAFEGSPESTEFELLVVIVCYRAADLTIDCLRTLMPQASARPGVRVAICENGTGGDSLERLETAIREEGWADLVGIKAIHPNRGFAGGNNAILRDVLRWEKVPRYVLLLNTDTLLHEGALDGMLDAIEARPDVGILGPRIEWLNGDPQNTTYRFRTPITEMLAAARTGPLTRLFSTHEGIFPLGDEPMDPDWLSFACAIIRREVLERVGILDESFYLYYDDLDYCRRAKEGGWRVFYWPKARIVHLRGQSNPLKSLARELKRRPRYFYASRSRYFAKFYGPAGLWLTNLLWTFGRGVSLFRELLGGKRRHICEKEWLDIWTNWQNPMKPPSRADAQR